MNNTYHARAQHDLDESGGRYAKLEPRTVVGTTAIPQMPGGAEWCSSATSVPDEPPLGAAVDAMEPCGEAFELRQSLVIAAEDGDPGADSLHAAEQPGSFRRRV